MLKQDIKGQGYLSRFMPAFVSNYNQPKISPPK